MTITVNNVNEAPSYSQDSTTRSVPENSAGGTNVGMEVLATDPDFSDSLAYTLFNGLSRFTIGSGTGQIQVASGADLDYEGTNSYDVTVRATDNAGLFDEIDVTINITNEVESASLTGLSVPSATLARTTATAEATLDNGDGAATTVFFWYQTPPGSGSWSSVLSEVTSGAAVEFDLTGLTEGTQYRAQASLDNSFPAGGRQQADFTTTANSGPVFPTGPLTREVNENSLAGHPVGDPVTATDADAGDSIAYTLGGNNASSFAIGSDTGQITVGSGTSLDYETQTSYSVIVTATDSLGATATVTVHIEVQDVREAGLLGRIVFTVGQGGGGLYGYGSTGGYGSLDSGEWPDALFQDDTARTVSGVSEDSQGRWYFSYSGGAVQQWVVDEDLLSEILVTVTYEDDRDTREFVMGGFLDQAVGDRGLRLVPPIPSRDWDSKDGEDVAIEFRRHTSQQVLPVLPAAVSPPAPPANTIADALNSTPGGPVVQQLLVTAIAFAAVLWGGTKAKVSARHRVLAALAALLVVPWAMSIPGHGETIASVILTCVVLAAASIYRYVTRPVR